MRLFAYMINILALEDPFSDYILINDIVLDESEYKKGTILGDDGKKEWYTYNHYRGKRIGNFFYQLGFKLGGLTEDEENRKYFLSINDKNSSNKEFLYFNEGIGFYYDNNPKSTLYNTSGVFNVYVYDENNNHIYTSPNINILPSSISYEDYIIMLNDLISIKDDLIISSKSNISISGSWEYRNNLITKCIDSIEAPIHRINRSPSTTLTRTKVRRSIKSKDKITTDIILNKRIHPFMNKFNIYDSIETVDIYENRIIKAALMALKERIIRYKRDSQKAIEDRKLEMENIDGLLLEKYRIDINGELIKLKREEEESNNQLSKELAKYEKALSEFKEKDNPLCNTMRVEFIINKNNEFSNENYSIEIGSVAKLIINSKRYVNSSYDLDLNWGAYKYFYSENERVSKFLNRRVTLTLETSRLNEIVYLLDLFYEKYDKYKIVADVIPVCMNAIDPLGGKLIPHRLYDLREYNINIKKIVSINGKSISNINEADRKRRLLEYAEIYVSGNNYGRIIQREENIGFIESIINRKRLMDKEQNDINAEGFQWDNLCERIEGLLKLQIFNKAKDIYPQWNASQTLISHPEYKRVWRAFRDLDKKMDFLNDYCKKSYTVKPTHEIYEKWCFYKILQVLIIEQKWNLDNYKEIIISLQNYLNPKTKKDKNLLAAHLSHGLRGNTVELEISYEKEVSSNEGNGRIRKPDYTFEFSYNGSKSIAYADAKYRNYNEQGKKQWLSDIKEVAIEKYIRLLEGTDYYPITSFIIHPNSNEEWNFYGGYLDYKDKLDTNWGDYPRHKFGSFSLTPKDTYHFKNFIRMILEYKLELYDYCWTCGETVISDNNIVKKTKKTDKGLTKYHYKCKSCEEFWVKSHCREDSSHNLIKHSYNYHSINDDKTYPWFVICPECYDGCKANPLVNQYDDTINDLW